METRPNLFKAFRRRGGHAPATVRRRAPRFLDGVLRAAMLSCLVLGGAAFHLRGEGDDLRDLAQERNDLAMRLAEAQTEITETMTTLSQLRSAEARIRAWLGMKGSVEGCAVPADPAGGRGSLGDVDLALVNPRDLQEATSATEPSDGNLGTSARALAEDLSELAERIQERRRHWDRVPALMPVDGDYWVSSSFGWRRSPFTGQKEFHSGVDIAGPRGTPVRASADGTVVSVVDDAELGRTVTLSHGNGIESVYGHLDKVLVKAGQAVTRAQTIGKMGSTGLRSTGPHLHYAIRSEGKYVNPGNYLLGGTLFQDVAVAASRAAER